jgi:hypothetical protein
MTIPERTSIASHIAAVVLCGTVAVCAVGLTVSASRTLDGVNKTLAEINAPCSSFHGSASCGTIAQISQTAKNIGILAGQGALQVKQSGDLIQATTRNLDQTGAAVRGLVQHASIAVDSVSGTAQAASGALTTASQGVQRVAEAAIPLESNTAALVGHLDVETAPLVTHADLVIQHMDGLAENPAIPTILTNFAGITGSTNDLLARGYLVEKKATQCYLYPTMRCRIDSLIVPTFQVAGPLIQAFK